MLPQAFDVVPNLWPPDADLEDVPSARAFQQLTVGVQGDETAGIEYRLQSFEHARRGCLDNHAILPVQQPSGLQGGNRSIQVLRAADPPDTAFRGAVFRLHKVGEAA